MKKTLIIGDTHCGALSGIAPPSEWSIKNKVFLEPLWLSLMEVLETIGHVDNLIINGDAIDGEGRRDSLCHLTTNIKRQQEIFLEMLDYFDYDKLYMTYGTPYHTAGSYSYEDTIAELAGAIDIKDQLLLKIRDGKKVTPVSIRHTSGRSDTAYCQGTQTYKEASRELIRSMEEERERAVLTIRHHVHYYSRVDLGWSTAITGPCLQIPESVFGRKCKSFYYHMGVLLLIVDELDLVNPFTVQPYLFPIKYVKQGGYLNA